MTRKSMERAPGWPFRPPGGRAGVLGHRGGRGPHRENTLEAFADALAGGADGVELDVRLSADGVPVVHHDALLPSGEPVSSLSADRLPPWLPTLEAALAACAGAVVDVEIKNAPHEPGHDPGEGAATLVAGLAGSVAGRSGWPATVVVTSFWPATLDAVRRADPSVAVGLLVHPALDAYEALAGARAMGASCLLPFHERLDAALVEEVHRAGLAVVTWTADGAPAVEAAVAAGADMVVTDDVRIAAAVVGRMGP